jgi:hypothetical protein
VGMNSAKGRSTVCQAPAVVSKLLRVCVCMRCVCVCV